MKRISEDVVLSNAVSVVDIPSEFPTPPTASIDDAVPPNNEKPKTPLAQSTIVVAMPVIVVVNLHHFIKIRLSFIIIFFTFL